MTDPTQSQIRDAMMLRGLNRTYAEIAAYLNDKYGLDETDDSVGRHIRELESLSEQSTPRAVFDDVVLHGYLSDLLG